jgi:hypothetical protein
MPISLLFGVLAWSVGAARAAPSSEVTRFAILEGGRASRSPAGESSEETPPRGVFHRPSFLQIIGKPNRLSL